MNKLCSPLLMMQPPLGTRRTIVLSGMYDGEVIEVVSAYRESGEEYGEVIEVVPTCAGSGEINEVVSAQMARSSRWCLRSDNQVRSKGRSLRWCLRSGNQVRSKGTSLRWCLLTEIRTRSKGGH